MIIKPSKKLYVGLIVLIGLIVFAIIRSGVFSKSQAVNSPQPIEVKAMQVVKRDTAINYEFVGKVASENEVTIMSKVSGNIVAKMVKGGDIIYKGQPLFRIDDKQYASAIRADKATLVKDQAALNYAQRDVERYRKLAALKGISQESLDSYEATVQEDAATVESDQANLQEAIENQQDTLIVSPVDGRIDVNDLSLGAYAVAGSTTLATVSSLDPIWVQFSMSENEYMKLTRLGQGTLPDTFRNNLKLILSDGSEYAVTGHIDQIDKGIGDTTGSITIKASFSNPQKFLLPGMFARIIAPGEMRQGALLIPQRAVKDLLDNTFVTVVTADNKAESRQVKLGGTVDNMVVVEDGLTADDRVVVEGIDKVNSGSLLKVTMIGPDDLKPPVQQ